MGGDGGSFPQRMDEVKTKKKQRRMEKALENILRWRLCTLTQMPLKLPIVIYGLGRLYIKEAVIEALISKTLGESAAHIKSLRDVCNAQLTTNPAFAAADEKASTGNEYTQNNIAPFICPIVGVEMNGVYRFYMLWTCGHVLSEKAIKEVQQHTCLVCNLPYSADDMVVINCSDVDELNTMHERIKTRRAAAKKDKADKKIESAATAAAVDAVPPLLTPIDSDTPPIVPPLGKRGKRVAHGTKLEKLDDAAKKAKPAMQQDPNTSSTFKSLFTTSQGAINQPKAAWVTHHSYYY